MIQSEILEEGESFRAMHERWLKMPGGTQRDHMCDLLNAQADKILLCKASNITELAEKGWALAWRNDLTHRPVPDIDDDYHANLLGNFLFEIEDMSCSAVSGFRADPECTN